MQLRACHSFPFSYNRHLDTKTRTTASTRFDYVFSRIVKKYTPLEASLHSFTRKVSSVTFIEEG